MSPADAEKLKVELKKAFDEFDLDKSGEIDRNEFDKVVTKYNASPACKKKLDPAQIKEMTSTFIKGADKDSSGTVSFQEFYLFIEKSLNAHCK